LKRRGSSCPFLEKEGEFLKVSFLFKEGDLEDGYPIFLAVAKFYFSLWVRIRYYFINNLSPALSLKRRGGLFNNLSPAPP
jgi:hypothetical protein